jgi:hypothetical protein
MPSEPDAIRSRADLAHYEPPVHGLDEPRYVATDPETDCVGIGAVEAEAVGNLIAVVIEYERAGGTGTPYVKAPGRVVEMTWSDGASGGLLDRLARLF